MIGSFFRFVKIIFAQRQLILSMAKREISSQYAGSLLGFVWTFINPLIMITVYWFVFSVGFRVTPMQDVPFVVWLTAGLAPWFAFSTIIHGSTSSVVTNTNLIKKTLFHSEILPVIKMVSSLFAHTAFLIILIGLMLFQHMSISMYYFQFFYYLFCLCALALGIGWALAALNVFFRDVAQVVEAVLQIGFWGTPIFWDIAIMPEKVQFVLKLNPVYYIIQGYRESFIYFTPFWHHPGQTLYFWTVVVMSTLVGTEIFRRLKPQFADVL